jgi:hypothetical protein
MDMAGVERKKITQMKRKALFVLAALILEGSMLRGQEVLIHTGLNTFFDNIEFAGSEYKISQTMAGIYFSPDIGIRWDSVYTINIGASLLHEFGSADFTDRIFPTAYAQYHSGRLRFVMGAFPRTLVLDKYPRMFYQDSVGYYRPNVNGILLEYGESQRYVNVWLDWTGRQTHTVREAFFVGFSGRYTKGVFYAQHYGYMFHYASRTDPVVHEALHDNILLRTSLGVDLSGRTFLDCLDASAGWVLGLERERDAGSNWLAMNGFHIDLRAEYRFAGIFNTLYSGKGLMSFYNDHDINLYWGDPAYRSGFYDRTDIYIRFLRKKNIDMELTWTLHFMEGRVFNEQMLKVKVDLNLLRPLSKNKIINNI